MASALANSTLWSETHPHTKARISIQTETFANTCMHVHMSCIYTCGFAAIKTLAKLSLAAVHCFLEFSFAGPLNGYPNSLLTATVTFNMEKMGQNIIKTSLQASSTEPASSLKYTQCPWQKSIGYI